jgi:hypothetical protein
MRRDARITGEIEGDHGNLGMNGLRPEQNGFCLLNVFGASKRISESDPPARRFRINLHKVAGNRRGHVPFPGSHVEVKACAQDFIAGLVLGLNLSSTNAASSNIPNSR